MRAQRAAFPLLEASRALARLGSMLRAARMRAGLSVGDVASRIGTAPSTVSQLEAGKRQPRHATLMRMLEGIPGMSAGELMLQPWPAWPPVHAPSAWTFMRELHGFGAESLTVATSGGERSVEIRGVRPTELRASEPGVLLRLMQAVFQGSGPALTDLSVSEEDLAAGRCVVEAGGIRHEYLFATDLDGEGFEYRCQTVASDSGTHVTLDVPVGQLRLIASPPSGDEADELAPRVRAWPIPLPDDEPDITRDLHPRGLPLKLKDDGSAEVVIERPLPGLRYELAWERDAGDSAPAAAATHAPEDDALGLGAVLKRARNRAGLGVRELADRIGVSHATVLNAENVRSNPTYRTLQGYARWGRDLRPQDVFPVCALGEEVTLEEVWAYYRRIYGFEARELVKAVTVDPQGRRVTVIDTCGLTSVRGDLRDLRIRTGLQRAVTQAAHPPLGQLSADRSAVSVDASDPNRPGPVRHRFTFSNDRVGLGIDYRRTYEGGPRFTLSAARAPTSVEGDDPLVEGAVMQAEFPTRRLQLSIDWSEGFEPLDPQCHAWPACMPPTEEPLEFSRYLQRPVHVLSRTESGMTLSMRVDYPMVGVKYAISWVVPD